MKEAIGMKPGEVSEELAEVEQELGASSGDEDEALLEAGKRCACRECVGVEGRGGPVRVWQ